jgi:hypothetical protein
MSVGAPIRETHEKCGIVYFSSRAHPRRRHGRKCYNKCSIAQFARNEIRRPHRRAICAATHAMLPPSFLARLIFIQQGELQQ